MVLILVSRRSFYFGSSTTAEKDSLYPINQSKVFLQKAVYIGLMERPTRPENAFATSIDR